MGWGSCSKCAAEKRKKPCTKFVWNGVSAVVKTIIPISGNSAPHEAFRKCLCGHHFIDHD